jgi:hypothetical protein
VGPRPQRDRRRARGDRHLLAESLHLQLDAFAEQADRLVGGGPTAPDGAPEAAAPAVFQDPHELRISGKALRYTLEMAAVQGHELPGSLTKTFKKMQEALGLWHDYVVLGDRATQAALDALLSHHEPELMKEVLSLLGHTLDHATHELDRFKKQWRAEGEGVARSIRQSFPLTRPMPRAGVTLASEAPAASAASGNGASNGASNGAAVNGSETGHDPSDSAPPAGPGGCPPAAP